MGAGGLGLRPLSRTLLTLSRRKQLLQPASVARHCRSSPRKEGDEGVLRPAGEAVGARVEGVRPVCRLLAAGVAGRAGEHAVVSERDVWAYWMIAVGAVVVGVVLHGIVPFWEKRVWGRGEAVLGLAPNLDRLDSELGSELSRKVIHVDRDRLGLGGAELSLALGDELLDLCDLGRLALDLEQGLESLELSVAGAHARAWVLGDILDSAVQAGVLAEPVGLKA